MSDTDALIRKNYAKLHAAEDREALRVSPLSQPPCIACGEFVCACDPLALSSYERQPDGSVEVTRLADIPTEKLEGYARDIDDIDSFVARQFRAELQRREAKP